MTGDRAIQSILPDVLARLGAPAAESVHALPNDATVADATQKFVVRLAPRTHVIVIISNPVGPEMVGRNVARMRMAHARLPAPLHDVIDLPLIEGAFEGRSYAVWRMQRPFSSNRFLYKLQKMQIEPKVIGWICAMAAETLHFGDGAQFAAWSNRLADVPRLSSRVKAFAAAARLGFAQGEIAPRHVLQHGDFWIGNILRAPTALGFIVIDWPGATLHGLPFFDIVNFCGSVGARPWQMRRHLRRYGEAIGCEPSAAMPFVVAALGRIHSELGHLPESRFVALCEKTVATVLAAGAPPAHP